LNGTAFHSDGALRVVWFQNFGQFMTRVRGPGGRWGPSAKVGGPSPYGDWPPIVATYGHRMAGVVSTEPMGGARYTGRISSVDPAPSQQRGWARFVRDPRRLGSLLSVTMGQPRHAEQQAKPY
jgi:hypothetical protein